jgi:uncharacterized damage-inducible protein DinB
MNQLLEHIQSLLVRDLLGVKKELELFETDEQTWNCPTGISNPAGTLAIHICGNLNHYIGAVLGGTSYVRDRNNEFANRSNSRTQIYEILDETSAMLASVIPEIDPGRLNQRYPEQVGGFDLNTQQFLLHLCTHLSFHLGQLGYLRRLLSAENKSTGPIALGPISMSPA